jgi:hypothetical protein
MKFVPNSVSRVAVAAGVVLVLGGSAVGIASAQTTPTPTPSAQQQGYQKFVDALAQRLGISSQQLQSDISQARQDAGLPPNGGFGGGRGGPGGPRGGFRPFVNVQVAAQAIGITPQQLRSELPGKSLAQVAANHGKQESDVVNALTTAADARIDQAVASGRLTADQGDTQKADAANRIKQQVEQVTPQGGPGAGGPGASGTPGAPAGPGRGPGGPAGVGFGLVQQGLDVAAQAIGITPQQLRGELPGSTLSTVATNHGKQPADVDAALKNAANARIDQAVANGRLTADQGNAQKTNIDNRIDQLMTQTIPQGPARRGPGGGQQGGNTGG